MNKDAIYVIKQPVHSIVSIIVVNGDRLPIHPIAHRNIDTLSEMSDVVFVFSDHFSNRGTLVKKFANLYRACSYIHGSGDILGKPIFQTLAYCVEIFRKHSAFIITDTERLEKVRAISPDQIMDITASSVIKPIFRITRLGPEELHEIYTTPVEGEKKQETFPKWKFWKKVVDKSSTDRINSTFNSPSGILYFKASTVKVLLQMYEDEKFGEYVDTFSEDDLGYLFASYVRELGIDNMDRDIEDLKVDINGEVWAERAE